MPVRHVDDFRRKPITSWDTYIDEAIREAQDRGEFDDLPDHGRPIKLEDTPFAPEMSAALLTLKNAGYEPTWMELDKAITRGKEDLDRFLAGGVAYLGNLARQLDAPTPAEHTARRSGWWPTLRRRLSFAGDDFRDRRPQHALTPDDLVLIRARLREQYLERAAAIDKQIGEFHAALPRNLWHLERMRLTQEAAARAFDAACPPVVVPA